MSSLVEHYWMEYHHAEVRLMLSKTKESRDSQRALLKTIKARIRERAAAARRRRRRR